LQNTRPESNIKKRSQRQSASLTRNGERREKKRSRTRSNEAAKHQHQQQSGTKNITAITTLKIDEQGRPITVTSEIKHNNPENLQQQHTQINPNSNKMELAFATGSRCKNRKKRPSREFLQRSADESESTEDSEIFWNGTDVVMDELSTGKQAWVS
jgi:hypothetical protein